MFQLTVTQDFASPLNVAILLGAGVISGYINTLAGAGSLLTLPLLMLLGLPADLANGTNRVATLFQTTSGTFGFYRAGQLQTKGMLAFLAPAWVGAILGTYLATIAPNYVLRPLLLAILIAVAFLMILPEDFLARLSKSRDPNADPTILNPSRKTMFLMFFAGVYGGFVQAGVGLVLLTVLNGLLGFDLLRANAIKVFAVLTIVTISFVMFAIANQIVWPVGLIVSVGAIVGAQLGVHTALRVSQRMLRGIIFCCVIAMSIALFARS